MSSSKTLCDALNSMKNHRSSGHCSLKKSNLILDVVNFLSNCGLIISSNLEERSIKCFLNNSVGRNPFISLKTHSSPSKSLFCSVNQIKLMIKTNQLSIICVSTNKGLLSAQDCLDKNVGGKVLFML